MRLGVFLGHIHGKAGKRLTRHQLMIAEDRVHVCARGDILQHLDRRRPAVYHITKNIQRIRVGKADGFKHLQIFLIFPVDVGHAVKHAPAPFLRQK